MPYTVFSTSHTKALMPTSSFIESIFFTFSSKVSIMLSSTIARRLLFISGQACVPVSDGGLRIPVNWRGRERIETRNESVRVRVNFGGVRPEDCRLYVVYFATE